MSVRARFLFHSCILALVFSISTPLLVHAQSAADLQAQIDAHNQAIDQLNQQIAQYEAKIKQADATAATLKDAISTLSLQQQKVTAQVKATQNQIAATQLQIQQLGKGIANTQDSITATAAAVSEDLRGVQADDTQPLMVQLLSSHSISEAWKDVDSATQVQVALRDRISTLASQKTTLINTQAATQEKQNELTAQKATLATQQKALTSAKSQQTRLLAETNANEAQYQKLLKQAKAQLASFSAFTTNAGGSGLLSNQTSCDSWGCYYNQRDVAWGNDALNGTQYRLKSDGCLVTSMAMILTHYGYRDVTPVTINSNPSNFAAYYPAYLLYTIYVDGMTVTRKTTTIDASLAAGNPVVVGLNAYGGTHFVVLTSGSRGNYTMRDPYVPNGKDIPFTSHYRMGQIFGVSKVLISS